MEKWEYNTVSIWDDYIGDDQIKDLGRKGWELSAVIIIRRNTIYYFKRPVPALEERVLMEIEGQER